jgi:hypothetical protein
MLDAVARDRALRISRDPNVRFPIFFDRCPVHHALVSFDGDGHLTGRCDGCASEAADATRSLRAR